MPGYGRATFSSRSSGVLPMLLMMSCAIGGAIAAVVILGRVRNESGLSPSYNW